MGKKELSFPPPLICGNKILDFAERSYVMGILNVTPDSFSDGNRYFDKNKAVAHGIELVKQGADIIDVGGESTRPGSFSVSAKEELERVIPVIRDLACKIDVTVSIDTTKAEVAQKALDAGAEIVNDISALRFDPDMGKVVSDYKVPVIIMHMQGTPRTMQKNIHYDSLINDVSAFLKERIKAATEAGIDPEKIIVDPGIGFGKSLKDRDNFSILKHLETFKSIGRPLLVGPSRKAFIAGMAGEDLSQGDNGTCAAVAIAVCNGADIVRVHNVRAMKIAARIADAVKRAEYIDRKV